MARICQTVGIFILVFCVGTIMCYQKSEMATKNALNYSSVEETSEIVVELAIICDVDFSNLFHHDKQKLLSYWEALLWDVHLRFKSLQNVSVSFRANYIVALEHRDEQYFLEKFRKDGLLWGNRTAWVFGRWLHDLDIKLNFNKYDIAVFAIGSKFDSDVLGASFWGQVCARGKFGETIDSVVVLSMQNEHMGQVLTHEIAHLLGSHHDTEESYKNQSCGEFIESGQEFLMRERGGRDVWKHFFSPCSQKSIQGLLHSSNSSCLRRLHTDITPLIDTAEKCAEPKSTTMSMEDQCKILTRDSSAYVTEEEASCEEAKCFSEDITKNFSGYETFEPFDGTSCIGETNKAKCFWGSCVEVGGKLINWNTSLCLRPENSFHSTTNATLYSCLEQNSLSPLDFVRINKRNSGFVQLTALYFDAVENKTGELCLAVNGQNMVVFQSCEMILSQTLWKIPKISSTRWAGWLYRDFMLLNVRSNLALAVMNDLVTAEIVTKCTTKTCSWGYFGGYVQDDYKYCVNHANNITTTIIGYSDGVSLIHIVTVLVIATGGFFVFCMLTSRIVRFFRSPAFF